MNIPFIPLKRRKTHDMNDSKNTVHSHFESPLGRVILAARQHQLVGIWFDGQNHQPNPSLWPLERDNPVLQSAEQQLRAYFSHSVTAFDLPLDLSSGSAFQQSVWRALLSIPSGKTTSYGALSALIGKPTAARAVGAAIGRNPFSIVIPCHRVIAGGGALTGYAGGLERKTALLKLEGAI